MLVYQRGTAEHLPRSWKKVPAFLLAKWIAQFCSAKMMFAFRDPWYQVKANAEKAQGWWEIQKISRMMWMCLKMLCTPKPNGFADQTIPIKWLAIIGNIPYFQTNPCGCGCRRACFLWSSVLRRAVRSSNNLRNINERSSLVLVDGDFPRIREPMIREARFKCSQIYPAAHQRTRHFCDPAYPCAPSDTFRRRTTFCERRVSSRRTRNMEKMKKHEEMTSSYEDIRLVTCFYMFLR